MKKLLPIIAIVIVVAVVGFYLLGSSGSGEFAGSLTDALRLGRAQKCTWEDSGGQTATFWMKDENTLYAEIPSEGGTGYLLVKDSCLYSWEAEQGVKICSTPAEGEDTLSFEELSAEAEVSLEEEGVEYNCKPEAGGSRFDVPTNVEFFDFGMPE
ncbi:MAG: hypothetical protein WD940_01610 [Patescibacteria group bacterium]